MRRSKPLIALFLAVVAFVLPGHALAALSVKPLQDQLGLRFDKADDLVPDTPVEATVVDPTKLALHGLKVLPGSKVTVKQLHTDGGNPAFSIKAVDNVKQFVVDKAGRIQPIRDPIPLLK